MLQITLRSLKAAFVRGRSLGRNEAGSMVSMLAVIPVLAGTVAIGVETGELYRTKRQMQSAADDAALAGSIDRMNNSTSITTDAKYETQRNGFTDGVKGVTVTVNSPPLTGPNVNTSGAVEVIVAKKMSLDFGNVLNSWLGKSTASFTISARSVAAQGSLTTTSTTTTTSTSAEGCIVALTTDNEQGVSITNFNNFTTDCSIMSNGTLTSMNSSASIAMGGSSKPPNNVTIHSTDPSNPARIWTRGSFYNWNSNQFSADAILQNQTAVITDPYASLPDPSPGACTVTNYVEPSGEDTTLSPGTYCGGLSLTTKTNVHFRPGTYYIANGDLIIQVKQNIDCSPDDGSAGCTSSNGITFVMTQTVNDNTKIGGVVITADNNITLNAGSSSSTNTFPGVLFYQDRRAPAGTWSPPNVTSTSKIFTVSSLNNATLSGAIYFPKNAIDISNVNNFKGTCTIWIGRYINFSSFNNAGKSGCSTYGTTPAGVTTTTTQTTSTTTYKNRVME
jgi:Flp pilus assembly protein TadG